MHRSRISTLLIDAPQDQAEASAAFWAAALGVRRRTRPGEPQFTSLHAAVPGLVTAVQSVDDQPRYHLDIETDDVPAENARLEALGAVEVSSWLTATRSACRAATCCASSPCTATPTRSPPRRTPGPERRGQAVVSPGRRTGGRSWRPGTSATPGEMSVATRAS